MNTTTGERYHDRLALGIPGIKTNAVMSATKNGPVAICKSPDDTSCNASKTYIAVNMDNDAGNQNAVLPNHENIHAVNESVLDAWHEMLVLYDTPEDDYAEFLRQNASMRNVAAGEYQFVSWLATDLFHGTAQSGNINAFRALVTHYEGYPEEILHNKSNVEVGVITKLRDDYDLDLDEHVGDNRGRIHNLIHEHMLEHFHLDDDPRDGSREHYVEHAIGRLFDHVRVV